MMTVWLSALLLCPNLAGAGEQELVCPDARYVVTGVVVAADTGQALENASVSLWFDNKETYAEYLTGSNGRYEGTVIVPLELVDGACREPRRIAVLGLFELSSAKTTAKIKKIRMTGHDGSTRLELPRLRLPMLKPSKPAPERRITVACSELPRVTFVSWTYRREEYEKKVASKLKRQPKGYGEDDLRAAVEAFYDDLLFRDEVGYFQCYEIHSAQIYKGRDVVGVWTKLLSVDAGADYARAIEDVDFQLWILTESGWKLRSP